MLRARVPLHRAALSARRLPVVGLSTMRRTASSSSSSSSASASAASAAFGSGAAAAAAALGATVLAGGVGYAWLGGDVAKAQDNIDDTLDEMERESRKGAMFRVPWYRPYKRYMAYLEEHADDPFFQSQSRFGRFLAFAEESIFGAAEEFVQTSGIGKQMEGYGGPLLPPPMRQRQYTLVIDLDVLLDSVYDKRAGLLHVKRPHMDVAIDKLARKFELILITDVSYNKVQHLLGRLDPMKRFDWLFTRTTLVKKDGRLYLPINQLGRDLSRVLLIDEKLRVPEQFIDNQLVLKSWHQHHGAKHNVQDFNNLVPFLYRLEESKGDVRQFIRGFRELNEYIPDVYGASEREMRLRERMMNLPVLKEVAPDRDEWNRFNFCDPLADEIEAQIKKTGKAYTDDVDLTDVDLIDLNTHLRRRVAHIDNPVKRERERLRLWNETMAKRAEILPGGTYDYDPESFFHGLEDVINDPDIKVGWYRQPTHGIITDDEVRETKRLVDEEMARIERGEKPLYVPDPPPFKK